MIKYITKSEYEERFPKVNTYGFDITTIYLENGVILLDSEWNGEDYMVDGKIYKPVYSFFILSEQWKIIGFEERGE